jgi:hypothetical protein
METVSSNIFYNFVYFLVGKTKQPGTPHGAHIFPRSGRIDNPARLPLCSGRNITESPLWKFNRAGRFKVPDEKHTMSEAAWQNACL